MTLSANARYYTDLAGLGELRRQARQSPQSARAGVAREFEAMFVQTMLARMREAMPATEDELLGAGGEMYRDLLDKQLALEITDAGGIGMARQIEHALSAHEPESGAQAQGSEDLRQGSGHALRMPFVPDAVARERAAEGALEQVQRSLERMKADPFNGEILQVQEDLPAGAADTQPMLMERSAAAGALRFESPEQFVRALRGAATKAANALGTTPDVLLAQAALETGWGRHVMQGDGGRSSYNLFGIKADARWQGPTVDVTTTEYRHGHAVREKARFRAYTGYEESFRDYVAFLRDNPRYGKALAQSDEPHQFIKALQHAGYATDPHYANKVVAVMRGDAFATRPGATPQTR